jgi:hypothetical protein
VRPQSPIIRIAIASIALVALAVGIDSPPASGQSGQLVAQQQRALEDLFNYTGGRNWKKNANWESNPNLLDPLAFGLTPTPVGGRILMVALENNALNGRLPESIGDLSDLSTLRLQGNQLTGTIPAQIGNLENLWYLNIHDNELTGRLPPEIGRLTDLIALKLYNNHLSGPLPSEIGNLTQLQQLFLENNQFSALPREIGNLTKLRQLRMWNNQLSKLPPEIGNLSSLAELRLQYNQLVSIPPEIANLRNLGRLELQNNMLTGLVPEELMQIPKLEYLDLSNNRLLVTPEFRDFCLSLAFCDVTGNTLVPDAALLVAGDADQDLDFDQVDLVRVQVAGKYLTGEVATWGEGDWNGAPGGTPGHPPQGDGLFNQLDIIAAQHGGAYLAGSYAAIMAEWQEPESQSSSIFKTSPGPLAIEPPSEGDVTSTNTNSASVTFRPEAAQNLTRSFDNESQSNIYDRTFGSGFGSSTLATLGQASVSEQFVEDDVTVFRPLNRPGRLAEEQIVYVVVPEPSGMFLFSICLLALAARGPAVRVLSTKLVMR